MVKIYIERKNQTIEINFEGRIKELLEKLNINEDTVVIVKNDEIVTSDEKVHNNDEIKLLSVISGG